MKRAFAALTLLFLVLFGDSAPARESAIPQLAEAPEASNGERTVPDRSKSAVIAGSWDFEGPGGTPDPQGWTHRDRTDQAEFFTHVDDFAGLSGPYGPLAGSRSLWCGVRNPLYTGGGGYENGWDQRWQSREFTVTGNLELSFEISYDTEGGADFVYVEYEDLGGNWITLQSYDGLGTSSALFAIPSAVHDGNLRIRFRMASDSDWSDEDGLWPSHGAYILDNLVLVDGAGIVDSEDFEGELVGALATDDGDWSASGPIPFGDYSALVDGTTVEQPGPASPNSTHVWSFFNGSPDDFSCGGFPQQTAVRQAYEPEPGMGLVYIDNEILSPWMPVVAGPNGSLLLEFDLYRPAQFDPQRPGVMILPMVYSRVGTVETERADSFVYYSDSWDRLSIQLIDMLEPGATEFRVGLRAVELSAFAIGCHDAAPLVDNIEVSFDDAIFVTTRSDASPSSPLAGSLRWAIERANSLPGADQIKFRMWGAGPHVITLNQPLPPIAESVFVDGLSQPGSNANTQPHLIAGDAQLTVVLDGSLAGTGDGLVLDADGVTVRGLVIQSFSGAAVRMQGSDGVVSACIIGADPAKSERRRSCTGVLVMPGGDTSRIGGPMPADRVFFADHRTFNVRIAGGSSISVENTWMQSLPPSGIPIDCGVVEALARGIHVNGGVGVKIRENHMRDFVWPAISMGAGGAVSLERNSIVQDSSFIAFDIASDGPNPNDPGDGDVGLNGLQNHPVIDAANSALSEVSGTLNSTSNSSFMVELFANSDCNPSGFGDGDRFLGSTLVTTDATGQGTFSITTSAFAEGEVLTANATNAQGETSEFGACYEVLNTMAGSSVDVNPVDEATGTQPVSLRFDTVSQSGTTSLDISSFGPALPNGEYIGNPPRYLDITTTASFQDLITLTVTYDEDDYGDESSIRLYHYPPQQLGWVDITTEVRPERNEVFGVASSLSPFVVVGDSPTGVVQPDTPLFTGLLGAHPNPFNPRTTISYALRDRAFVHVEIFDLAGRRVRRLVNGEPRAAGVHQTVWNGTDDAGHAMASGIYFYRLNTADHSETRKLTLIK